MWGLQKNVTKNSRAVLCKGVCQQWFHFKCTDLTVTQFNTLYNTKENWYCNKCDVTGDNDVFQDTMSVVSSFNEGNYEETVLNNEINTLLTEEIENQKSIIKILNEDLVKARKQINNLEKLVLDREEEIIKLKYNNNDTDLKVVSCGSTKSRRSLPCQFELQTSNFFQLLQDNETDLEIQGNNVQMKVQADTYINKKIKKSNQTKQTTLNPCYKNQKKKILLCSDSHGKNLVWHINKCQQEYESVGFVRPGGKTKQIVNKENITSELKSREDILVVLCGSNDVAANEAQNVLHGIKETLSYVRNNKVLLVNLPNRYDLASWSCVNKEVQSTNVALADLSKEYSNVSLIEASQAERHLHTYRHPWHAP